MIEPSAARNLYVIPALNRLGLYSVQAERLLMGTAAVESNFVNFVQFSGGPARGMFQMEPLTFNDMLNRVLANKKHAAIKAAAFAMSTNNPPTFVELTTNHLFAAAMARIKYYSIAAPIPIDLDSQAQYWWTYYNGRSPGGVGVKGYLDAWNTYCAALYK
jgi:hypothetical protein